MHYIKALKLYFSNPECFDETLDSMNIDEIFSIFDRLCYLQENSCYYDSKIDEVLYYISAFVNDNCGHYSINIESNYEDATFVVRTIDNYHGAYFNSLYHYPPVHPILECNYSKY